MGFPPTRDKLFGKKLGKNKKQILIIPQKFGQKRIYNKIWKTKAEKLQEKVAEKAEQK